MVHKTIILVFTKYIIILPKYFNTRRKIAIEEVQKKKNIYRTMDGTKNRSIQCNTIKIVIYILSQLLCTRMLAKIYLDTDHDRYHVYSCYLIKLLPSVVLIG